MYGGPWNKGFRTDVEAELLGLEFSCGWKRKDKTAEGSGIVSIR